jgi:hypothetical protein
MIKPRRMRLLFILSINLCFASFSSIFIKARAENSTSSVLLNFKISQCYSDRCLKVNAEKAFVSRNGDTLVAADTHCELVLKSKDISNEKVESYFCRSFHYDIRSQFLICDNRQSKIAGLHSFTMDSNLVMMGF